MKKTILLLSIIFISLSGYCQNAIKDANGNYTAIKRAAGDLSKAKTNGSTFTDSKNVKYPVYETDKGKLFIIRTSAKTKNTYKMYLKL